MRIERTSAAWLRALCTVLAAVFLLAAPLLAAEEGAPKREDPFTSPVGWAFRWLQFAIVASFFVWLLGKKGPGFFRRRAETIVASITESTKVKEEAGARLRDAEEKLARLPEEVAGLREAARRDAAAEAERIRAAAREEAQKIERAAQAEMEAAERAARMELKAMAARLAVERAEAQIRQQMTPVVEASMVRAFVEDLARSAS